MAKTARKHDEIRKMKDLQPRIAPIHVQTGITINIINVARIRRARACQKAFLREIRTLMRRS